jgi:hypothetical protein
MDTDGHRFLEMANEFNDKDPIKSRLPIIVECEMLCLSENMSEFKYACPVCGQHIKCDSSQCGTVMDCPTCFQKIIAPQAASHSDSKIILTGQKIASFAAPSQQYSTRVPSGKKIPTAPASAPAAAPVESGKRFPVAAILLVVLVVAAGAGVFAFRGKIFKSGPPAAGSPGTTVSQTGPTTTDSADSAGSATVTPSANDTNWTLNLAGVTIPDGAVVGRIHGQDFVCTRATFQKGSLALRAVAHGTFEFGVTVDFSGEEPEVMAGKSFNISNNVDRAAKITLRWKENGEVKKAYFQDSYVLRLDFGPLNKTRLPGKIYLCTPDDARSYIMGTFDADTRPPKPKS